MGRCFLGLQVKPQFIISCSLQKSVFMKWVFTIIKPRSTTSEDKPKGLKLFFLGHSMATTSGLIYASLRPEEAKENIKAMILLAPVAYVDKVESILRYLSFFLPQIQVRYSFNLILLA
jgi:hypothetical protein